MNRLQIPSLPVPAAPLSPATRIGLSIITPVQGDTVHSRFVPLHYEKHYAYPLIVWLHGPGDDERQLQRIMPHVSMRNYVAVAPRGTSRLRGLPKGAKGFTWLEHDEHVELAEHRIFAAVSAAMSKYHISNRRIFLAGFDCGGTMAFRVAMNHPNRFAGALSLGGRFPTSRAPLWRLPEARRVPLFIANGRQSDRYAAQAVCDDLRLFHVAGMEIAVRLYPAGHEITTQMLADVDRWIMDQLTGQHSTTP